MATRYKKVSSRLGEAFRLRGAAKRRYGATTAGGAWVVASSVSFAINSNDKFYP